MLWPCQSILSVGDRVLVCLVYLFVTRRTKTGIGLGLLPIRVTMWHLRDSLSVLQGGGFQELI